MPMRVAFLPMDELQDVVVALAEELHVPGVAVGVLHDGREAHAFHGVTSIENPLPVDERTLFLCGSTTKTFTATAIVRLVGQGLVDLDAPARTYVPELQVEDEEAAASVTVLQLLNHTSGWDGDFFRNTGDGDDALARYVEAMSGLRQLTRPGAAVSYNNAAFGVAGRLVEKVTGSPYEAALRELVLEPLDLQDTLFFSRDLVTRRFAVDHQRLQDGGTNLLPFGFPRATNPVGGLATTTRDLIAWARFQSATAIRSSRRSSRAECTSRRSRLPAGRRATRSASRGCSAMSPASGSSATVGRRSVNSRSSRSSPSVDSPSSRARTAAPSARRSTSGSCSGHGRRSSTRRYRTETSARTADEVEPYCGRYETVANLIDVTPNGDGVSLLVTDRPEVLAELGAELEQEPPVPFLFGGDRTASSARPAVPRQHRLFVATSPVA